MDWYYVVDGESRGPVAAARLAAMVRDGELPEQTLVWRDGMPEWVAYESIRSEIEPEQASLAQEPPVPTGPPDEFSPYAAPASASSFEKSASPSLGLILGQTMNLWKKSLPASAILYGLIWFPLSLVIAWADVYLFNNLETFPDIGRSVQLSTSLDTFIGIIATAAVFQYLSIKWKDAPGGFGEALGVGFKRWGWMLLTYILMSIILGVGLLLAIIPGLYLSIRLCFAAPCVVLEKVGTTEALSRSFELTKDRFWTILGYTIVAVLIMIIPYIAFGIVEGVLNTTAPIESWIGTGITDALASCIAVTFFQSFTFVFYQNLARIHQDQSHP